MDYAKLIDIVKGEGFSLARRSKHQVFKRGSKSFVLPSTPSDVRGAKNALSDLARLCGKTRSDLLGQQLPLRALRPKGRLEPLPELAPQVPVPQPEQVVTIPPVQLSKADRKLMKRAEKYTANAQQKEERRRAKLIKYVEFCADVLEASLEAEDVLGVLVKAATLLMLALKADGYTDAEVVCCSVDGERCFVEDGFQGVYAVRCCNLYLDFIAEQIHNSAIWELNFRNGTVWKIEAICTLRDVAEQYSNAQAATV